MSILVYVKGGNSSVISFMLGLLACVSVIVLIVGLEDKLGRCIDYLAKYTLPIFLMHTLFAASLRAVLLKLGKR